MLAGSSLGTDRDATGSAANAAPGYVSAVDPAMSASSAPGYVSAVPDHVLTAGTKRQRPLIRTPSIDATENMRRVTNVKATVLAAEDVRTGLSKLAAEHVVQFKEALAQTAERALAPNCTVKVATAGTGSGAEVFTVLAVIDAFKEMYPHLKFEYVFNCDKNAMKRKFVHVMHEHLAAELGQSELPCVFDDILSISKGEQRCSCHIETKLVGNQRKKGGKIAQSWTFRFSFARHP